MPPPQWALSDAAIRPSVFLPVRLSVPPGLGAQRLGQLGAQLLDQATRAVRTADLSAHGHRSAAMGGGHIVSPRNHGLRGSASPVLTATGFVNGRWQFSTPHRIHTP